MLSTALGLSVGGQALEAADVLMSRFKACQRKVLDGDERVSKFFELVPVDGRVPRCDRRTTSAWNAYRPVLRHTRVPLAAAPVARAPCHQVWRHLVREPNILLRATLGCASPRSCIRLLIVVLGVANPLVWPPAAIEDNPHIVMLDSKLDGEPIGWLLGCRGERAGRCEERARNDSDPSGLDEKEPEETGGESAEVSHASRQSPPAGGGSAGDAGPH
jgi:hypothetical protein